MNIKLLLIISLSVLLFSPAKAQESNETYTDSLNSNLIIVKRYLSQGKNWHFTDPVVQKRLSGLIDFIENEPVDSIITYLLKLNDSSEIPVVFRLPENVSDSLKVPGYVSSRQVNQRLIQINQEVEREFSGREVALPANLMTSLARVPGLVPEGQGMLLFTDRVFTMPDSLKILDAIPDNMVQSSSDFRHILKLDSIRSQFVEQKRRQYNDSITKVYRDRIIDEYKRQLITSRTEFLQKQLFESVRKSNYEVLKNYNELAMATVNDSLKFAINWLTGFADLIDNTTVNLLNLTNASSPLVLSNSGNYFTRVWLKNQQNDSLAVLVRNIDKRSMQLAIEDGVTFSRFRQQAVRDFDFGTLNKPSGNLDKMIKRYQAYTPWTIGGDGALGFTQTYLENWKKGGKSALSILVVAKGFANYSFEKVRWENSGEIRNGWVKPGEEYIQKTDDKFQLTSRLGVSAFQKWFYSTEADFETQLFYGYRYPNKEKPISGLLAPGRLLFKLGFDYKPNKNLSLFISPLTSKTVFVMDTSRIDQTNFGIDRGKRFYWEPGLNTDFKFKKEITPSITFETKYRMFINYMAPFKSVDIDWENLISMQLNDYISIRTMIHSIYDSKVLFDKLDNTGNPVLDANGKKIREHKLQFKEFVTIGFTYKINRRVLRAREIK